MRQERGRTRVLVDGVVPPDLLPDWADINELMEEVGECCCSPIAPLTDRGRELTNDSDKGDSDKAGGVLDSPMYPGVDVLVG